VKAKIPLSVEYEVRSILQGCFLSFEGPEIVEAARIRFDSRYTGKARIREDLVLDMVATAVLDF
jgi:hypothetical protein